MTTVGVHDIHNIGADSALPCNNDAILCFWNAASDTSIFLDNPTATARMKKVLSELGNNMHSHGTLIIAMDKVWTFNVPHIACEFLLLLAGVPGPTHSRMQESLLSSAQSGQNQLISHATFLGFALFVAIFLTPIDNINDRYQIS